MLFLPCSHAALVAFVKRLGPAVKFGFEFLAGGSVPFLFSSMKLPYIASRLRNDLPQKVEYACYYQLKTLEILHVLCLKESQHTCFHSIMNKVEAFQLQVIMHM